MTDKITESRRKLFEQEFSRRGHAIECVKVGNAFCYSSSGLHSAWIGFCAALDAVEIVLPSDPNEEFCYRRAAVEACRAAIESTNLGLRVK